MIDHPWFLLYDGTSVDGRGNPHYAGRTLDIKVAKAHLRKCMRDPYSIGNVRVVTDESIILPRTLQELETYACQT